MPLLAPNPNPGVGTPLVAANARYFKLAQQFHHFMGSRSSI